VTVAPTSLRQAAPRPCWSTSSAIRLCSRYHSSDCSSAAPPAAQMAQIAIMRQAQTKASTPSTESIQSGAAMGMPVLRGLSSPQASKGVSPESRTERRSATLSSCSDTSCSAAMRCRRLRSALPDRPFRERLLRQGHRGGATRHERRETQSLHTTSFSGKARARGMPSTSRHTTAHFAVDTGRAEAGGR
jgi:hypothetical protein